MIGKNREENNTTEIQQNYSVKVKSVKAVKQDVYAFTMTVNGVTIYNCWYREGVKDGKEWSIISFPAQKGSNGKYYNHVSFPISDDLKTEIIRQMESLLGG